MSVALCEVPIGRVEEELVGLAGQLSAGLCRWLLLLGRVRPAAGVGRVGDPVVRALAVDPVGGVAVDGDTANRIDSQCAHDRIPHPAHPCRRSNSAQQQQPPAQPSRQLTSQTDQLLLHPPDRNLAQRHAHGPTIRSGVTTTETFL